MKVLDAALLAAQLHEGQVDKAGQPYILHCLRVASAVARQGGDEDQQIAALLHDVVEDKRALLADLLEAGVPARAVYLIAMLSRSPGQPYGAYLQRVRLDRDAMLIKRCDLADNMDRSRLMLLPERDASRLLLKYNEAMEILAA